MIERFFPAGTTAGSQDCSISLDDSLNGKSRPVLLIGRIAVQSTAGRDSPPDPISDFPCGDPHSPFGKGHIMALSLGGPDVRANIVPQYEQWQANGRWRAMETAAESSNPGDFFVAAMAYADSTNALPAQTARFKNGEIFDWAEYRIPTEFKVWIVAQGSAIGQKIATKVLKATVNSGDRLRDAQVVKTDLAGVAAFRQFDHSVMPDEDRQFWQDLVCIVPSVRDALDEYNEERAMEVQGYLDDIQSQDIGRARMQGTMADVMRSPPHTTTTFVLEHTPEIRDVIWDQYGSSGSLVHNFAVRADVDNLTTDRILRAHRFAKQSGSLQRLKDGEAEKRRKETIKRTGERKTYAGRYHPYEGYLRSKGKDT
jgi:hypothetical protein